MNKNIITLSAFLCLSFTSCSDGNDAKSTKEVSASEQSSIKPTTDASNAKTVAFENALGMKFTHVPAANVWVCVHETRNSDFWKFALAKGQEKGPWKRVIFQFAGQNFQIDEKEEAAHPVINVTVKEAMAFCDWLTQELNDGNKYRLPSSSEWSTAAGFGTSTKAGVHIWGTSDALPSTGNYWDQSAMKRISIDPSVFRNLLGNYDDKSVLTAPVMAYKPNSAGIYDLGGNVKEWCLIYEEGKPTRFHMRDASWAPYFAEDLEWNHEGKESIDFRGDFCGFRVVAEKN